MLLCKKSQIRLSVTLSKVSKTQKVEHKISKTTPIFTVHTSFNYIHSPSLMIKIHLQALKLLILVRNQQKQCVLFITKKQEQGKKKQKRKSESAHLDYIVKQACSFAAVTYKLTGEENEKSVLVVVVSLLTSKPLNHKHT